EADLLGHTGGLPARFPRSRELIGIAVLRELPWECRWKIDGPDDEIDLLRAGIHDQAACMDPDPCLSVLGEVRQTARVSVVLDGYKSLTRQRLLVRSGQRFRRV